MGLPGVMASYFWGLFHLSYNIVVAHLVGFEKQKVQPSSLRNFSKTIFRKHLPQPVKKRFKGKSPTCSGT